ncbi:MAG: PHP domain-containing protein [Candidatus Syntropharchaeia archaeon]
MNFDLHVHSKYSRDSCLEPEEIVKVGLKRGLDGIAVTDHETIKGGIETKKYEREDFMVICGCEILTNRGEVIGLFLSEEILSRNFFEVISEIRDQDGIVILPHPFDRFRYSVFPDKNFKSLIDGVEGFNSRCILEGFNRKAMEFAENLGIPATGGSDAHSPEEIGNGGTIVEGDLREAIAKNKVIPYGRRSSLVVQARARFRSRYAHPPLSDSK